MRIALAALLGYLFVALLGAPLLFNEAAKAEVTV
jgi:hypothetical protein